MTPADHGSNPDDGRVDRLRAFLAKYPSPTTRKNYAYALSLFFSSLNGAPTVDVSHWYSGELTRGRDALVDVDFFVSERMNGRPPKTVRMALSAIRMFLEDSGVAVEDREWRKVTRRVKGSRARTVDRIPTKQELVTILQIMGLQARALYTLLPCSGLRMSEALKLKVVDIDVDSDPAMVTVRGETTKSGNPRYTFCTKEAVTVLKSWVVAGGREAEVFSYGLLDANQAWRRALKKAGLAKKDPSTGIHTLHPHCLRKFFSSTAKLVIPSDVVEAMMGHEGYLDDAYRRYSVEQLKEFYKKAESILTLSGNAA